MGCRSIVTVVSWPAQITLVAIKLGKQLGRRANVGKRVAHREYRWAQINQRRKVIIESTWPNGIRPLKMSDELGAWQR